MYTLYFEDDKQHTLAFKTQVPALSFFSKLIKRPTVKKAYLFMGDLLIESYRKD